MQKNETNASPNRNVISRISPEMSANSRYLSTDLIQQVLQNSPYVALRAVRCESIAGIVVLRGRVTSFYLKQIAQQIVRNEDKECPIVNELTVVCREREDVDRET